MNIKTILFGILLTFTGISVSLGQHPSQQEAVIQTLEVFQQTIVENDSKRQPEICYRIQSKFSKEAASNPNRSIFLTISIRMENSY